MRIFEPHVASRDLKTQDLIVVSIHALMLAHTGKVRMFSDAGGLSLVLLSVRQIPETTAVVKTRHH